MRKKRKINWKQKADDIWSLLIRIKHQRCEICGRPGVMTKSGYKIGGLNAHHIIGRSNLLFRHDPCNGHCLCVGCHHFNKHCSPHAGSIIGITAYVGWFKRNKPDQWQWFEKHKSERGKPKQSFEEIYNNLKELIEQKNFEIVY